MNCVPIDMLPTQGPLHPTQCPLLPTQCLLLPTQCPLLPTPLLPQSFLSSFSAEVHTAKSSHFHNKINNAPDMRDLFRTFNSLLCPPPPPPTTSITADDFATFLQTKLKQSAVSSHLHSHRTPNQLDPLLKLPSSPSVPSLRRKYPNFSSPAILQHVL